jgi:hypothetical protein
LAPAVREVNEQLAVGSVAVQVALPSLTVTVPVGVPPPGDVTAKVNATVYAWPTVVAVDRFVVIVVVVLALLTVCAFVPVLEA